MNSEGKKNKSSGEKKVSGSNPAKSKKTKKGLEVLNQEIDALKKERDQSKENFLRASAELKNFKRRAEEEKMALIKAANVSLILSLFKVIDNFDRALGHVPENISKDSWFTGMKNTKSEFDSFLEKQGIKKFAKVGDSFDPNLHEALLSEKGAKDKIMRVVESGIFLGEKVVRTAKVSVGNGEK